VLILRLDGNELPEVPRHDGEGCRGFRPATRGIWQSIKSEHGNAIYVTRMDSTVAARGWCAIKSGIDG
jgi:hypothetical protein